jgi:NADH-quinone oxidoreductase subunit I
MYCGICIEVCPYDALFWSPEFSYAETDIRELTHERGRLREWMWTVPPPPAHDPGAPVAKEVQAVYGPGGVPNAGTALDASGVLDAGGALDAGAALDAGGAPGARGAPGADGAPGASER